MAVNGKEKVKAQKKVHQLMYGAYYHDVAILFDGTCGHRIDNTCCDKRESHVRFLSLIVSLLAVAGIFMIVGAPFAGALEIIVYAGAIMVLFVFVVMMLNLGQDTVEQERKWLTSDAWAYPALMSFLLGLVLVWMLGGEYTTISAPLGTEIVGPKAVGQALFTHYLLLVEVAAMLLLAALVAAYPPWQT